jgi:quercetin dioxygenase-like cupin family protein
MRPRLLFLLALLTAPFLLSGALPADEPARDDSKGAKLFTADSIKWKEAPSLPKGAMIAVLEGDPAKAGLFVMRVKLPDGCRIMPHTHPRPERVTVLAGTLYFGMGATFDEKKGKAMPAGSFGRWPAGMKHFGWVKGETVLQLHGEGPWVINYLKAEDDPARKK